MGVQKFHYKQIRFKKQNIKFKIQFYKRIDKIKRLYKRISDKLILSTIKLGLLFIIITGVVNYI